MHPISEILCRVYAELYDRGQVSFPLQDDQRQDIDSIVKTVNAVYFGAERFRTPEERAVAYLCYLIKDHPVVDGNKRLALLWFEVYCDINELRPDPSPYGFDELALAIERADMNMEELMATVRNLLFRKVADETASDQAT